MKFVKDFTEFLIEKEESKSLQLLDEYLTLQQETARKLRNFKQIDRRSEMKKKSFNIKSKFGYVLIKDGIEKRVFDNSDHLIEFLKDDYNIEYTFSDVYLSALRFKNKSKSAYVNEKNKIKYQGIEIKKFLN